MKFNILNDAKNCSGVYIIKNNRDDRTYIGSTKNFYLRYKDHLNDLKNKRHSNKYLQNFVNKYGLDKLEMNLLCICQKKFIRYNEMMLIKELKPMFNLKPLIIESENLFYNREKEEQKFIKAMDNFWKMYEERVRECSKSAI